MIKIFGTNVSLQNNWKGEKYRYPEFLLHMYGNTITNAVSGTADTDRKILDVFTDQLWIVEFHPNCHVAYYYHNLLSLHTSSMNGALEKLTDCTLDIDGQNTCHDNQNNQLCYETEKHIAN